MDGEAWWETLHGVTKSRTRLKQLSMHAKQPYMSPGGPLEDSTAFSATANLY